MMMMTSSSMRMKSKPSKYSWTLLPCFYFLELPIVASSMISLYFLELTDLLQPAQVGFRCHDRDLSLPYVDGGAELVPLLMLLSLAFSGPAAAIMLVEGLTCCLRLRLKLRLPTGSHSPGGCGFSSFLRRTVHFVGVHVFGLCATALLTDIIQLSTGHHAPFFLTVCQPNYTLAGLACDGKTYITQDICSGHDQHAIMAARKSFPSQHATLSAFAAVFVSVYLNSTLSDSTKLLKPVLVFTFVIAAVLTGLTQISQHRSHPADVYVGFLIGAFIAVYLAHQAVASFRSSDEVSVAPACLLDPLQVLTERGHKFAYSKGPASDLAGAPATLERLEALGPDSAGSLRVEVELLAPRSPMGKETMLTFSNMLPSTSGTMGGLAGADDPGRVVQPVQRRLRVVQVPQEPPQQLLSEWKPTETPELSSSSRELPKFNSMETYKGGWIPTLQATGQRGGAPPRAAVTPRPPQMPEAERPPVSPKSAVTRAKWLEIRAKMQGSAQPHLQGGARSTASSASGENLESTTTGSTTSSIYHQPAESQKGSGLVTMDGHYAPFPPQSAHIPVITGKPHPAESVRTWRRGEPRDTHHLKGQNLGGVPIPGSSF